MNVFLSIVVDGFITATEEKLDASSILKTVHQTLTVRRPADLGGIRVMDAIKKAGAKNGQQSIIEDPGQLKGEIDEILHDARFSKNSLAKARLKVLQAIEKHAQYDGDPPAVLTSEVNKLQKRERSTKTRKGTASEDDDGDDGDDGDEALSRKVSKMFAKSKVAPLVPPGHAGDMFSADGTRALTGNEVPTDALRMGSMAEPFESQGKNAGDNV